MATPKTTWEEIIGTIHPILKQVLGLASPSIKEEHQKFIGAWYKKAKATENPMDDCLVELVVGLLNVDIS